MKEMKKYLRLEAGGGRDGILTNVRDLHQIWQSEEVS